MKHRRILRSILTPAARVLGRWAEGILREPRDEPVASDDGSLPATPENWLKLARVHAPHLLEPDEAQSPGHSLPRAEARAPVARVAGDEDGAEAALGRRAPDLSGQAWMPPAALPRQEPSRDDHREVEPPTVDWATAAPETKRTERRRSPLLGQRPPAAQGIAAPVPTADDRAPGSWVGEPARGATPLTPTRQTAQSHVVDGAPDSAFSVLANAPTSPPRRARQVSNGGPKGVAGVAGVEGVDQRADTRPPVPSEKVPEWPPEFAPAPAPAPPGQPFDTVPVSAPGGFSGTWSTATVTPEVRADRSPASRFPSLPQARPASSAAHGAPRATAPVDRWPSLPDHDLNDGTAAPEMERIARRLRREEQEQSDP